VNFPRTALRFAEKGEGGRCEATTDEGGRAERDGFVWSTAMTEEVPRSLLRSFAPRQRAQAVQAEALIWRAVRNRRCDGAKFQRQVPRGNYILDFVCFEHRLIVEIDGPSHDVLEQRLADEVRDVWLRDQGFRVLRLPNELVIASTGLAVARIRDAMTD